MIFVVVVVFDDNDDDAVVVVVTVIFAQLKVYCVRVTLDFVELSMPLIHMIADAQLGLTAT